MSWGVVQVLTVKPFAKRARYMTLETISQMSSDPTIGLPAVAS